MLTEAYSPDHVPIVLNLLLYDQPACVEVSKPEKHTSLVCCHGVGDFPRILGVLTKVFFEVIDHNLQFEQGIGRVALYVITLALEGPKKYLCKAIAIIVCVIRTEKASRLGVLQPYHLASLNNMLE